MKFVIELLCRLLILSLRTFHYVANTDVMRGEIAMDVKTLELLGYDVMVINTDKCSQLDEDERISFIMREIDQRLKVKSPRNN